MKTIKGDYSYTVYQGIEKQIPDENTICSLFFKPVGSIEVTATDKERIAFYIACAPDFSRSKKLLFTESILNQWVIDKDYSIRIAKCFLAGKLNPKNPLQQDLDQNLIDEHTHDHIWLHSELIENIWKMVSLKWEKIKKIMTFIWDEFEFKFETPLDFFIQYVHEEFTDPFLNWTQSKYKEFSKTKNKKMSKLLRKHYTASLNDEETKLLSSLLKVHRNPDCWTDRLLNICACVGDAGDIYLDTHMKIHRQLCDGIAKLQLKGESNPKLKEHATITHSWQNGVCVYLNKS